MKRILVYYLYSQKNAGDMAICFGLLDLLSELKDCEITMVSRYSKKDASFFESKQIINKYHPNVIVKPGYIGFDRAGSFFSKAKAYFKGFFLSLFPFFSKRIKDDITNCDLILFNGGNYLRCNSFTDRLRLKALFTPLKIAKKRGKSIFCMPQSTAKAKNQGSINTLKKYCKVFDQIFIREPISYSYLIQQSVGSKADIIQSCDLAFFTKDLYKSDVPAIVYNSKKKKRIAVNARVTGIGDIGYIDQNKITLIESFYKNLILRNKERYDFSFVCQTEKDYAFMKHLYDELLANENNTNLNFYKSDDAYELKSIYSKHDLLISMRLHASILAISSGTPVIGFSFDEWGFKNKGILNQFGFKNFTKPDDIVAEIDCIFNTDVLSSNKEMISVYKNEILESLNQFLGS